MLSEGGGWDRAGTEYFPGPVEHLSVPRAQEAVIAHFDESVRQHVLKKPTNELLRRHRSGLNLISGRFLVLKGDVAIFQREDTVVADGYAKDVRRQVSEGFLATTDGLAVHDPVLVPDARIHEREQIGLFQLLSELRAEEHRQGLDVDQEVLAGRQPGTLG
jgi:hypothetical protein